MKHVLKINGLLACFLALLSSCTQKGSDHTADPEFTISCDAENGNEDTQSFINGQGYEFGNFNTQSGRVSRSGNYSVMLTPDQPYGMTITIGDIQPDEYYRISVWRYGSNDEGILVADGVDDEAYYGNNDGFGMSEDGWEKITLDVFTPPINKYDKLKIYCWNKGKDTIFFDDLKIERLPEKTYPEYEQKALELLIEQEGYDQLYAKRKQAFERGVLVTESGDYVKVKLKYGADTLKAKVRLKGDWLDHLQGQKWSFRVKMRKDDSWKGMRTFNIQTPLSRGYLHEWTAHELLLQEDVLTTRYGFVPVKLNGKSLGIYAYEEHFDRHLLERNKRREAPIMKLSEDFFWQIQKDHSNENHFYNAPCAQIALIEPFKENRIQGSPELYGAFLNGQDLIEGYRNGTASVTDVFEIDQLAKYYALTEVLMAFHGFIWHNIRFYINPVTSKLEPIAYDCYASENTDKRFNGSFFGLEVYKGLKMSKDLLLFATAFENKEFTERYLHFLQKYSDEQFLKEFKTIIDSGLQAYEKQLKKEFQSYSYNYDSIIANAEDLRENLAFLANNEQLLNKELDIRSKLNEAVSTDTIQYPADLAPYLIKCYKENDKNVYEIRNFLNSPVRAVKYSYGGGREVMIGKKVVIPAKGKRIVSFDQDNMDDIDQIYFETGYLNDPVPGMVMPWRAPRRFKVRDNALTGNMDIIRKLFNVSGNKIMINSNVTVQKTILIPEGYEVHFSSGAALDLTRGAAFISYSPVYMKGTRDNPVRVHSGDGTGMGFIVLQAGKRSLLNNVRFEQLNTLDMDGWTLTGGVSFYESDVDMDNVWFTDNRCEDALNIILSDFYMNNCRFDNIFSDAFDSDFGTGTLKNSFFRDCGNDAIDFSGSVVDISDCKIVNVTDKGISSGERSELYVSNVSVKGAKIGVASKDLSLTELNNITLENCRYGIIAFKKKAEFGPAKVILNDRKMKNIHEIFIIEEGSVLLDNDNSIRGTEDDVADMFYL